VNCRQRASAGGERVRAQSTYLDCECGLADTTVAEDGDLVHHA
jgi:hypothetical protein